MTGRFLETAYGFVFTQTVFPEQEVEKRFQETALHKQDKSCRSFGKSGLTGRVGGGNGETEEISP